jgi:tetratricopeptide (TPR) repeat protein
MSSGDPNVHTRVTLPPPEWAPAPIAAESPPSIVEPMARREGRKAEEATLRATLDAARASSDDQGARRAAIALARHLASRERDLDEAVDLGLAALERGDDVELRKEVASWFEMLGEPGTAAMVLRKTNETGASAAATMVRVGTLLARAGDGRGAAVALEDAAKLDPEDATALELRGALAGWAPDAVDAHTAARAFAEAAVRRKASGTINGELEDALRAFEVDRSSDVAKSALETALRDRGRTSAADHAARAHALAQDGAPLVHRALVRLVGERLASASYVEALGLSFDAGLDRIFSGEDAAMFDGILLRLGLLEGLASRLEMRLESRETTASERRGVRDQLARLFAGPLGSASRAARQHVRMVAEDPAREESLLALHEYGEAVDRAPLVEALVRGTAAESGDAEARAHCARALALLAEERLHHAPLAQWAYEQLRDLAASDVRARELLAGLGDVEAHVRRLAPQTSEKETAQWRGALADALVRDTHNFGLGRWLLRQELAAPDEVEARAELATAARLRGDFAEACVVTAPLAEVRAGEAGEGSGARSASLAWVNGAVAGDARLRARAIEALASFSAPAVRCVLLACASDALCASDVREARRLAEAACAADAGSARALVALANASIGVDDRAAASLIERTATAVYATRAYCEAIEGALAALGERDYAVAWTQRLVALRPGDGGVIGRLVKHVIELGDAARLMDAVLWLLPQPLPASMLGPLVASALDALATLDAQRAAPAARRALDALGPRSESLTAAIARAAERAGDGALTAALLTRRAATFAAPQERVMILLELANLTMQSDPDGALRALAQAVAAGADPTRVASVADAVQGASSADAELWRAQIRATALEVEMASPMSRRTMGARSSRRANDVSAESTARALRQLGAMQWDMAGDGRRAIDTWLRAARIAPTGGYAALGVDLARFAGAQPALERLQSLVAGEKDPMRAGSIAAEAARASLAIGAPVRALELAEVALAKNPLVADAIEIAERGAMAAGRVRDLSRVYDALGARARGRFGRRAAHYRGARFFDQRGEKDLALKHAAQAFAAVPSEGGTFFQLARIAERAGDASYAVRTIEEVADASPRAAVRAGWLLRAAQVAGGGDEGARMRVDVLLKAAFLQPMPSTLALLGDAAREMLSRTPEERPVLQVRFSKARAALAKKLEGPDGARVALAFTSLALELFDDVNDALASFARALDSDADLEEYVLLVPHAPALAQANAVREVVAKGVALVDKPFSNVGVPALRFLGALADAAGDIESAGRFRMAAAERESDDDELVRLADLASPNVTGPARERFEKKVSPARRIAAHTAFAEAERLAGRYESAIASLERVAALGPPDARAEVDANVRGIYELAGRAEELERRALSVAEDEQAAIDARVEAWLELASLRERRGDVGAATESLRLAARLDPTPLERWSQLERVAALAGNFSVRAEALVEIETRVAADAKPAVLRRLAHAHEDAGDLAAVEATWHRVLALRPDDEEADFAIEELLARQNEHARLADHLEKRAERLSKFPDRREMLRVVRLRRAAILEQRLGLLQQACEELERVVSEWPNNESALRYLGDLLERQNEMARAVVVYRHLATLASDETSRAEMLVRAATAARRANDAKRAEEIARSVVARNSGYAPALLLLGELAREKEDFATLAQTLVALAASPTESAEQRSDWLIEAAQASARAGDTEGALDHAQKAAMLAPHRGAAQLFARGLEYRLRRAGTPEQARETLAALDLVNDSLGADDDALAIFLRAEALDVAQGGDAGLRFLERCIADQRSGASSALVHVAIAERLGEQWKFADALPHWKASLEGSMLGLRSIASVALSAAEAAVRAERVDEAIEILERASSEPSAREDALKKLAQVAASAGDLPRARRALEDLLGGAQSAGDRASALAQLGRLLFAQGGEIDHASEMFREAIAAAPADTMLRAQLEAELGALAMRGEPLEKEPSEPNVALDQPTPLGQLASAVAEAPAGPERTATRAHLARAHIAKGDLALGESLLLECLAEGDVEAGELLASLLERDGSRASDLLRVRRLQVEHAPGDARLLRGLRDASLHDRNAEQARAIDHVLRAFDAGAGPLPPPPLSAQVEHPGMLQLLARPAHDPIGEALALVWEGASSVLARDPASYALTGVERVTPGPQSPLARLYELASRLLGAPNVPLYARRRTTNSNPPSREMNPLAAPTLAGGVALLPTLSSMILGDVREDSPALRCALGQAFAAALPQSALLLGLPESEAQVLWNAMLAAFGPPEFGKLGDPAATRLVQTFWNTIPPRSQRRLQELLARAPTDFNAALERARQSGRRVALFLCGDIGFVLRVVAAELELPAALLSVDHLSELVEASPIVSDLVRLAVSAEYADGRFRAMPEGGPRGTLSSGRYKIL